MATEDFVQKQIRLVLEQQVVDAFTRLALGPLLGVQFTLLGFDFGPGSVAYKTTVPLPQLVTLSRGLLDRWASKTTKSWACGDRSECVPAELLVQLHDLVPKLLPAGVGYALLIGSKLCTAYLANADRGSMTEVLGKLATAWEEEMQRANN